MRDFLGKPISTPVTEKCIDDWAGTACKNQNGYYDWRGHQQVIRHMAFQICEDVNSGTRDPITLELRPTSYDLVGKIEKNG